jgi:cytochrome P450
MLSFILASVAFPDAIRMAQKEIDSVVGYDRSPDWSDERQLVYCKALIKEVLRWRSVAILGGLPHAPTRDDTYRGYLIPENTSIMVLPLIVELILGKYLGYSPSSSRVSRTRRV